MTTLQITETIKDVPLGTLLHIKKTNGDTVSLRLASYDIAGEGSNNYDGIEVPALPPALVVKAKTHVGNTRIPLSEIEAIEVG